MHAGNSERDIDEFIDNLKEWAEGEVNGNGDGKEKGSVAATMDMMRSML